MRARLFSILSILVCSIVAASSQTAELTIVNAGPSGEIQQLQQANEIRIVFSEPMVALGRIPSNPTPPWITITPAVTGTFRWSGTTILIFTPDAAKPLPNATAYRVAVSTAAESVGGRRLRAPYSFTFTTPTVRLTAVRWARRGGQFGDPITLALDFNQVVRPADVLAHLVVRYVRHEFEPPTLTGPERARLTAIDAAGLRQFDAKVAEAQRNAARTDVVAVRLATDWDRTRFLPAETRVMLETVAVPPPGTSLEIRIDAQMPSPQGPGLPGTPQTSVAPLADAFFARGMQCRVDCIPSRWNPIQFTEPVATARFATALSVTDITDLSGAGQPVAKASAGRIASRELSESHSVEDAGFTAQPAARAWVLRLDPTLQAGDGQTLGYPWIAIVSNWNDTAFTSFGDGHGVWESSGGPQLPFYSRNFQTITERIQRLSPADLMPRLLELQKSDFRTQPTAGGTPRRLAVSPNQIQSYGLDMRSAMGSGKTGIFWAGIQPGDPIARARAIPRDTSTVVQVTNLGLSVKDSPQSTLIFVTTLDTGQPVGGAAVSIINTSNKKVWSGSTGKDGVAMAPALPLRNPRDWYDLAFLVMAEKDGDVAYVGSDWNEGIMPWDFSHQYDLWQQTDILRGSVFTDRGVYKPGETVQVKAIVRSDTPAGIRLLKNGAALDIRVRDARNKEVDRRTVKLGRWSSVEWTWAIPSDATLGHYQIDVRIPGTANSEEGNDVSDREPTGSWLKEIDGGFLVAAYRRPDFQVNATLTTAQPLAGEPLAASVTSTYLFGGSMAKRPVKWSLSREVEWDGPPSAILEKYPRDKYTFSYYPERLSRGESRIAGETVTLDASGRLNLSLSSDRGADLPYRYTFEGDVEDVSRQHIANRASVLIHPASLYIGIERPTEFASVDKGASMRIVTVDLSGRPVPGIRTTLTLVRVQYNNVRRAEGNGFYTWDSERLETALGEWTITTATEPVPFKVQIPEGGSYVVRASARDRDGRQARTDLGMYAEGSGYTAWERYDDNRITLEPERKTWKPGETARIMIKSPWETATALLTVEREGIRDHRRFTLTSTQQTVDVPITAADIPNVFVSVLLVRGRASIEVGKDGADPGKPAFRLGYTELLVADETKRLDVKVSADREEYRPANSAKVSVTVADFVGKPAASEVTLWAVDQGVLALTDYNAPDVAGAIYARKALQVMSEDSRQRIISRRVLTPKGGDEGGGGGMDSARTDFRPLAFWLGSVTTDRNGKATRQVTLPDSLTTYRIMAVAGDAASRFGSATATMRVTKPLTLLPMFPRFLALTDRASFGALVSNTQGVAADATVTIKSLDPALVEFQGGTSVTLQLPAGATAPVRFDAIARGTGSARLRVSVSAGANTDAFEMSIPVGAPARMETTAAFGDTGDRRVERLALPAGILPSAGGLTVEMASSALVGLGEGARYLADYPYGCAEQKSSAALALTLAADLGTAFSMGRVAPAEYRARAQTLINDLPKYQCADGGFAYWPGRCQFGNFYLTSYVLHVLQVTSKMGISVDADSRKRALEFLDLRLRDEPPAQVQWIPVWGATTAFASKILAEAGTNQDANITRLARNLDRLPVFALSFLADAMAASPARHPAYGDVVRRISNGVRVEGDRAHVEELATDELAWLWNSNVRSSALVLEGLARRGDDAQFVAGLVRGLLLARKNGRWNNTQENATALEALVSYYRKYEAEPPDMKANVTLGSQVIGMATFKGRSSALTTVRMLMPEVIRQVALGAEADLAFSRAGTGTLYYTTRLQYTPAVPLPVSDQGIRLERRYERVVEGADSGPSATTFTAGDVVRVTLTIILPKERRYVAVTDPLAAGFEAIDGWFNTTAADMARDASAQPVDSSFARWWRYGGFEFVDKFDDRVAIFATRLGEGRHEFSYLVRATTAGTFGVSGTWAEEMYAPEVNGRSAPVTIVIK